MSEHFRHSSVIASGEQNEGYSLAVVIISSDTSWDMFLDRKAVVTGGASNDVAGNAEVVVVLLAAGRLALPSF